MEFFFGALLVVLSVIPMLKILPHFGIEKWWALLCILFPLGMVILIWWISIKLQEMEER